jgi:hypothetical protein
MVDAVCVVVLLCCTDMVTHLILLIMLCLQGAVCSANHVASSAAALMHTLCLLHMLLAVLAHDNC